MKHLFHGSNTNITDAHLEPRVSYDYKAFVYATSDIAYAIVRCGKFNFEDISIREEYVGKGNTYRLVELRPNAFCDIFDVSGWLYVVNRSDFHLSENHELVSAMAVPILGKHRVANVWQAMQCYQDRYELITFEHADEYFVSANIDKAAYLERRRQRIAKIKSAK